VLYRELQGITSGEHDRLMISMPPRHCKSETVTVRYVAWRLIQEPSLRVVVACYSSVLAEKFSRKIRRICADAGVAMSSERAAVADWETDEGGGLRAVGVGGGVTGQGFDLLVIDDPVKSRLEAESHAYRERVWQWYGDDLYTRQEPGAAIVLIMTRWHQDDLAGRIMDQELESAEAGERTDGWRVLNLPAICENPQGDALGRQAGEALCPERFDVEQLERRRRAMGSASFAALYQGNPAAADGNVLQRSWWRYYDVPPPPGAMTSIVCSWDLSFKASDGSDYVAGQTWGVCEGRSYLLDRYHARADMPTAVAAIRAMALRWQPDRIIIEDAANGPAVIQTLQRETKLPVIGIRADTSKLARVHTVTPYIEAGMVELPSGQKWVEEFLDECSSFPVGAHDDEVDAMAQALRWILSNTVDWEEWLATQDKLRKAPLPPELASLENQLLENVSTRDILNGTPFGADFKRRAALMDDDDLGDGSGW
jgi:predicted phage terminase large subunit-like protein